MPGYIIMCLLRWVNHLNTAGRCAEPGNQCGWVEGLCGCLGNHSPSDVLDCKGDGHMDLFLSICSPLSSPESIRKYCDGGHHKSGKFVGRLRLS